MVINNIKIFGETEETQLAEALLLLCVENSGGMHMDKKVFLVLDGGAYDIAGADVAVIPYAQAKNSSYAGKQTFTYSVTDMDADFIAINRQDHESNESFELMTGVEMARIFIKDNSIYPLTAVLAVGAVLYASGINLADTVQLLNSILK